MEATDEPPKIIREVRAVVSEHSDYYECTGNAPCNRIYKNQLNSVGSPWPNDLQTVHFYTFCVEDEEPAAIAGLKVAIKSLLKTEQNCLKIMNKHLENFDATCKIENA